MINIKRRRGEKNILFRIYLENKKKSYAGGYAIAKFLDIDPDAFFDKCFEYSTLLVCKDCFFEDEKHIEIFIKDYILKCYLFNRG